METRTKHRIDHFETKVLEALAYAKRIVFRFTQNDQDAEDLLQDVAYEVLSRRKKYQPIIGHKRTVYLLLLGISSGHRRSNKIRYAAQLEDHEARFKTHNHGPYLVDQVLVNQALNHRIARMPSTKMVEYFKLHRLGIDYSNIAEKFKVTRRSVIAGTSWARKMIKSFLADPKIGY